MLYTTKRYTFRYGNESDPMECTIKNHATLSSALKYAKRYAKGIKFAGVTVEDENGKTLYEITSEGNIFNYIYD